MKKIFFILSLIISVNAYSQNKEEIKLNLKKSETYNINQTTEQVIVQQVMGQEQEIKSNIESLLSFHVKDVTKTGYTMDVEFKKLKLNVSSAYFNLDFDSEASAAGNDLMGKIFNKMMGAKSNVKINHHGEILEFKGIEDVYKGLIDELNPTQEQKMQLKAQLDQSFNDGAIKASIEGLTAIYPKEKVMLKEKWNNDLNLSLSIPISINNSWTYDEKNQTAWILKGESHITSKSDKTEINGMPAKIDMEGDQQTRLELDSKTGWLNSGNVESDISGTITLEGPEIPGGSMEIPMNISTKTVYAAQK